MAWTKEQEKAIHESGTNIIVSAGAGSGKTAVLSERVLRILKEGVRINELLILTFTNAAAREMKERIRKKIQEETLKDKSLQINLDLLDEAYITTFDSFALSIVKKYHYLLNIGKDITITENTIMDLKKKEIMDTVFLGFYETKEENFLQMIKNFCTKDDKILQENILKIADKISTNPDYEEYLDHYFDTFVTENFLSQVQKEYLHILLQKQEEINLKAHELSEVTDDDFAASLEEVLYPFLSATSLDDFLATCNLKLPILKNAPEEAKTCKEQLTKLMNDFKKIINTYGTAQEIECNIQSSFEYVKTVISIIKKYLLEFEQYKQENNLYDFNTIALLAIKILEENESVRNELKYKLKEIMIDEYQDTNDLQEKFINLIQNHNTYMVGDIKQSIYRFRNANPGLFQKKYDTYSKLEDGIKIDLLKNFRSRDEVLQNINAIFDHLMNDTIGGADYKKTHRMVFGQDAYNNEGKTHHNYNMRILEYPYEKESPFSKEEIEIFTIAKDIKEKMSSNYQIFDKDTKILRDASYSDFVILMDRSSNFDLYKKIFEYENIPLDIYKDESINTSDNIYILKNILDFIIKIEKQEYDQDYKYDFVSIARSYLFCMPDQKIFDYINMENIEESSIFTLGKELSTYLHSVSIKEFLEKIITSTHMYEKMITIGNIEENIVNITKILELAENYNTIGYDIYAFNTYLQDLIESGLDLKYSVGESDADAVKIMTIHKSKGLEYPICYYSGLYKTFNIQDLNERFLLDSKYGIITPIYMDGIKETVLKFLAKYNYIEEEISEKIRLFYVALTRAKETMILLLPKEEEYPELTSDYVKLKFRSLKDMLSSLKKPLRSYFEPVSLNALNMTKDYIYASKLEGIASVNTIEDFTVQEIENKKEVLESDTHYSKTTTKLIDKESKEKMEFGTKVHEYLEYLDLKHPDLSSIDNSYIKKKIEKFLQIPELKNIDNACIYQEYEFIYQEEQEMHHGIIDLMIEHDKFITIIDYKLKEIMDDAYVHQLEGYKTYIESITDKPVYIYLYSIIDETLKEVSE